MKTAEDMHPDFKEVTDNENEIVELEKRKSDIEKEISEVKSRIKAINLKYHKRLIEVDFYKNYILFEYSKSIDEKFYINPYNLPYSDHGEGNYIRIRFKISGLQLNLLYECSYNNSDRSLIRIPLNLLIDNNPDLDTFLKNHNEEALKTHNKILADAKQKKIDDLQKEIKSLR